MSNPVATFTQHNHITEAYKAGEASYAIAEIARELVTIYSADITGPQAIAAATELERAGVYTWQIRHSYPAGGPTYDLVTAAVNGAKARCQCVGRRADTDPHSPHCDQFTPILAPPADPVPVRFHPRSCLYCDRYGRACGRHETVVAR